MARRPRIRKRLPRQVPPTQVERRYTAHLLAYRAITLGMVKTRVFGQLEGLLAEASRDRGDASRVDAAGSRGKDIVDGIRRDMRVATSDARLTEIAREASEATNRHQKVQLGRQVKAGLGVDVLMSDAAVRENLSTFVQQNVSLIKSIPEEMLNRVEGGLLTGIRQNWRADELAEHLRQQVDVSDAKARFIARDQISKLMGELNNIRQTQLGIREYTWRTMQDERVRANHRDKEGNRYAWDDAPADTGHPGEDFACRCYAEPALEALVAEEE